MPVAESITSGGPRSPTATFRPVFRDGEMSELALRAA
jgi:hypothetical protein